MPTSVDAAAGETVTFYCITDAIPEPVNFWFINSEPIESKPVNQFLLYSLIKQIVMLLPFIVQAIVPAQYVDISSSAFSVVNVQEKLNF